MPLLIDGIVPVGNLPDRNENRCSEALGGRYPFCFISKGGVVADLKRAHARARPHSGVDR